MATLKAKLLQAMGEIEVLQEGNSSLKEQVNQLQDQLKLKAGLLKKETKKRRARLRAYIDTLAELTLCQAKCTSLEASVHQEPPQPETGLSREVELEKENQVLKEQVEQLWDQLREKDGLVKKETKKRRARLRAYLDSLAELTVCQAKCTCLETSGHQEPSQTETGCGREVELEKENQVLNEQVEQLQDRLKEIDGLLKKETKKRRARLRAYIDTLSELTVCQAKCTSLEAIVHQEPPQPKTGCGREVELERENQVLKEQVEQLKVSQRRLEDELQDMYIMDDTK